MQEFKKKPILKAWMGVKLAAHAEDVTLTKDQTPADHAMQIGRIRERERGRVRACRTHDEQPGPREATDEVQQVQQ